VRLDFCARATTRRASLIGARCSGSSISSNHPLSYSFITHYLDIGEVYTMPHDHTSACSTTHLFRYLSDYRILICLPCNYAVPPASLRNHVRTHRRELGNKSSGGRLCATMKDLSRLDLLDPTHEAVRFPLPTDLPIPDLLVFDGHSCVMCSFATRQLSSMEKH